MDVGERVDTGQRNEKTVASGPKKKLLKEKELKKPNKSDEMVGVVERYVKMKEKQAEDEKAESKCFLHRQVHFSFVQNKGLLTRGESEGFESVQNYRKPRDLSYLGC